MIFEPRAIKNVTFRNRVLRSSVGGRMAAYDGTVTDVWSNFEQAFADGGVGGIISTTFSTNRRRQTPFEYPSLSEQRFVVPLKRHVAEIKARGCPYIIQIGDPVQVVLRPPGQHHAVAGTHARGGGSANYVADWVMDLLDDLVGRVEEDIVVETTIDPTLQSAGESAIVDELAQKGDKAAAQRWSSPAPASRWIIEKGG